MKLRGWLSENNRLAYHLMQQIYRLEKKLWAETVIFSALASQIRQSNERSMILVDELVFQKNRSQVFERLLSSLKLKPVSFLTGQSTFYVNPPLRASEIKESSDSVWKIPFFVPDRLNADHSLAAMPLQDVRVCGNTRFDFRRIRKTATVEKPKSLSCTLLFLLSKPEYGVKLESLCDLVSELDRIPNQKIILKYHTRGLPAALPVRSPHIRHEFFVGSSELIAKADVVFFTSSSMVFEAFILQKPVCYLKFCQKNATIFDRMPARSQAFALREAVSFAGSPHALPEDWSENFLDRHVYNGNRGGDVCAPLLKLLTKSYDQLFAKPKEEQ